MELIVLKQAQKELQGAPKDLKADIFALFENLMVGKFLCMPVSKPLSSIAKSLHELRLSGKTGEYRIFYLIKVGIAIYVLHATDKKSQKIDRRTVDLVRARIRSLGL